MLNALNCGHLTIVENYIRAKDKNEPALMSTAFAEDATLEMILKTESISFPAITDGLDAITDILVRHFNDAYENVHTFCLADKSDSTEYELSCKWMVCMTERKSGGVRMGTGNYRWTFDRETDSRAVKLVITIEQIAMLPSDVSEEIVNWAQGLPYPWCYSDTIRQTMPNIEQLNALRRSIA
ncbi:MULTISPECIES: hypothetical protein [Enterovibrio]|uniref:hypothetical protein n=1 Tax=Enterovibrio TaxID=188143 RepID=UPI0010123E47|nr:hypothetical protein [Enterovibrio baiacu]MBE1273982.1 hypothetical protein [Enterovibrio baiacu]